MFSINVCGLFCNSVFPKMCGYINVCLIRNCVVCLFVLIINYNVVDACVLYKCLLVCNFVLNLHARYNWFVLVF